VRDVSAYDGEVVRIDGDVVEFRFAAVLAK
jgi:hypothetical protein